MFNLPLIHIGYHKTATTWLQQRVFSEPDFSLIANTKELWPKFVQIDQFNFDVKSIRESFQPEITRASEEGLVPVLSAERLSGSPHSGGYDSAQIAERLVRTLPEAKILIVIREQAAMLASNYKQYVLMGGPGNLYQYTISASDAPRVPLFNLDFLAYHRLIDFYQKLFGPQRVLVLPYELLRSRPEEFLSRLGQFAGVNIASPPFGNVTPSISTATATIKRQFNSLFVRDTLNHAPLFEIPGFNAKLIPAFRKIDGKVPSVIRRRSETRLANQAANLARGSYPESNYETQRLTGLDLSAFGYEL